MRSGEPIMGSATAEVDAWLLLEHRGKWERDIADTPLPAPVRAHLDELATHPGLRMQLIRGERHDGPLSLYVVLSGAFSAVHHFSLERYEDLLALDVGAILTGEVTTRPDSKPLYLVCTHGRRDRCCARYGVAFYRRLLDARPDAHVWQSSHQGGHRFAATVLYLPAGIQYGRLDPDEAVDLVEAHARGELYGLGRYRGQTRYSAPVQAAEGWLREQEMVLSLAGPALVDQQVLEGGRVAARFRTPDGMLHRLTVAPRRGSTARKASCDASAPELPTWFYVVRHEAQTVDAAGLVGEP